MPLRKKNLLLIASAVVAAGCSNNDYGGKGAPPPMANAAPVVAAIADVTIGQDTVVGPLQFAIGDDATPANLLVVTAAIDGTSPFPADGVAVGGDGATRSVTLTPLEAATGTADVRIMVADAQGAMTTRAFRITVNARDASVREAVTSTFAKKEDDEATTLNGFTFTQDADDPETFAALVGAP